MQMLHTIGLIIFISAFIRSFKNLIIKNKLKVKKGSVEAVIIIGTVLAFWIKFYFTSYMVY